MIEIRTYTFITEWKILIEIKVPICFSEKFLKKFVNFLSLKLLITIKILKTM